MHVTFLRGALIGLCLFSFLSSYAIRDQDSLWNVYYSKESSDADRLAAIRWLFVDFHVPYIPDSVMKIAGDMEQLAIALDDSTRYAEALMNKSIAYHIRGDNATCDSLLSASSVILLRHPDRLTLGALRSNQALVLMDQGLNRESLQYLKEAEAEIEAFGHKRAKAMIATNKGNAYMALGQVNRAVESYTKGLRLSEESGEMTGVGNNLSNIGNCLDAIGDIEGARKNYRAAARTFRQVKQLQNLPRALLNLSTTYMTTEPDTALYYMEKAIGVTEQTGDYSLQAMAYGLIGNTLMLSGRNDSALAYVNEGLEMIQKRGQLEFQNRLELQKARVLAQMNRYDEALEILDEVLEFAINSESLASQIDTRADLIEIYDQLGDYEEAYYQLNQYVIAMDELKAKENEQEVLRQQYAYEYAKQAAADSVAAAEAQKVSDAIIAAQDAELSQERTQRYALFGGLGLLAIFGGVMFNRFRVTSRQRDIIEEQKSEVEEAHDQLTEKNREILDSIEYAKRIQNAILPPDRIVKQYLDNSFILYKPKDVVAGDFYWMETADDVVYYAAADCTGHGVPGAMVSVICVNGLNRSVREFGLREPGQILDKTRELVIKEFEKSEEEVKDGMDISLCALNTKTNELMWSGANNPLWIVRSGSEEMEEIKADKQPIGKFELAKPFTTHTIKLQEGDTIYTFSDGYPDQFGGENGKKYKSGKFKRTLLAMSQKDIHEQHQLLDQEFELWRGQIEQIDDVCVIGVRV